MSDLNYTLDFELNDNNYLPNLFGVDDKYIQILEMLSMNLNLRPENLSVKDYCEIAKNI